MTKKAKILKLFNDADWIDSPSCGKVKVLSLDDFHNSGLGHTIEYGENYCDIIYARNIIRNLGYKVLVGQVFAIFQK